MRRRRRRNRSRTVSRATSHRARQLPGRRSGDADDSPGLARSSVAAAPASPPEPDCVFAALVEHPAISGYGTSPRPTWQFPLERMLRDARHIFVVLHTEVHDWWMLQCVADNTLLRKCVFVAPSAADDVG